MYLPSHLGCMHIDRGTGLQNRARSTSPRQTICFALGLQQGRCVQCRAVQSTATTAAGLRIWAVSDIHTDYEQNSRWVHSLEDRGFRCNSIECNFVRRAFGMSHAVCWGQCMDSGQGADLLVIISERDVLCMHVHNAVMLRCWCPAARRMCCCWPETHQMTSAYWSRH